MPGPRAGRGRVLLVLGLCLAFIVLVRLRTYLEPAGVDESMYAVVARELLHGARLYLDVWDIKPPLVYVSYAAAGLLTGFGPGLVFLLSVAVTACTLFAVYRAGRLGGAASGLVAAALWALVSHDVVLQGNLPNASLFETAALAWGFAWTLERRAWPAGLAFAAATLYMPGAVLVPAALAAGLLARPERSLRDEAPRVATWLAIGMAAWGATLVWAFATGRLQRFLDTIFGYGSWYVRADLATDAGPGWQLLLPLAAAAGLFALVVRTGRWRSRPWLLLAAYVAGATLGLLLQGHWYGHHFRLWQPPLAIAGGWVLPGLWRARRAWAIAAVAPLAAWELLPLGFTPAQWASVGGGPKAASSAGVAREIVASLAPGETFAVWGSDPQLYFMTGRRPPAGVLFLEHLEGPLRQPMSDLLLAGLQRHRPRLLVVDELVRKQGPVWQYLAANYQPSRARVGTGGEFSFWLRRAGAGGP